MRAIAFPPWLEGQKVVKSYCQNSADPYTGENGISDIMGRNLHFVDCGAVIAVLPVNVRVDFHFLPFL